jgi:hypothetical protein
MDIFHLPNSSRGIMALVSTQPVTEISARDLPASKMRPALKADVTAICELTI